MMSTTPEEILGWSAAFRRLVEAGVREGFAHATLVESDSAEGSAFYARALARAINCTQAAEARPCGACEPCRRAAAGSFPALQELWPIGVAVTIAQIQELIKSASTRYSADVTKVFVIHAADRMQIPAANALLKTLEEPPERTVLILATSSASRVLGTIRSRCRPVRLSLPEDAEIAAHLKLAPVPAARLALALEVCGRQPAALLEIAAKKKDLATWAPANAAELAPLAKKLLRGHKDTEELTPAHALLAGGWYSLALAGTCAAELGRLSHALAGGPRPSARRDALAASVGLTATHKMLIEETDDDWAKKLKALEEQYGEGYVHPQVAGEGKPSFPLGRAHAALVLRALLAVMRRVLHARTDPTQLEALVAPGSEAARGLSRLTPALVGEIVRAVESLKRFAQQNVSIPYVLDELWLSISDVLSGRALAHVSGDEATAEGA